MNFLVKDWKMLSLQSYTVWAFYVLVAITIMPDLLYTLFTLDTNPAVWGFLQIVVCLAGILGRLVLQPKKNRWRRRGIIAALVIVAGLIAVPVLAKPDTTENNLAFDEAAFSLISKWEGKRNASYQDIVGVWTICYGHTRTAGPDQYMRDEECYDLLVEEISEYRLGLHRYFSAQTKSYRLPALRDAAYTSLAFNVGIRAAGRSTATRRLNAGDIKGGCNAIAWWNKAGGRVVRGLVRRRSEERQYCLRG